MDDKTVVDSNNNNISLGDSKKPSAEVKEKSMEEDRPLLGGGGGQRHFKTYRRRWYILAIFAGLTLHQASFGFCVSFILRVLSENNGWL